MPNTCERGTSTPQQSQAPTPIHLKDYTPPAWLVDEVFLDVRLGRETTVTSKLKIRRNPSLTGDRGPLELDGENITLVALALDGQPLAEADYHLQAEKLILPSPPGEQFELAITTTCRPDDNKALSGLYRSGGSYCTQCEAEGFRRITFFPDRPDVLSVYTVRIEADKADAPVLLSNGNKIEAGPLEDGRRHYALWHDPHPKPCYLFALVGGDLACVRDSFITQSGRKVALEIYVQPGKEDRCAWAMDSLKRAMRWDERRFGREYDLDIFMIVAVPDFNMGAMENKGLNIFNDKLILARPDTATDGDYERIEAVIAHEYFHNWTGNRITCRDWFQLCLKEGLTVFRDQEFTADERSRPVKRIQDVRLLKSHQFPEDAGPLAHPVRPESYIEINNFYTATVYEKGAELCRMLLTILGRDGFRQGLDLYFARHDGEAATVEQFIACFEEACNTDLSQFMLWYSQAGTPEVSARLSYDEKAQTATLELTQKLPKTPERKNKKPQHIPFKLGLLDDKGHEFALKLDSGEELPDGLVHLRERRTRFTFTEITSPPTPSLLRDFSAPVILKSRLKDRDLAFLMAHDPNGFNRWQAAQDYALSLLKRIVKAIRQGRTPRTGGKYAEALGVLLADDGLEPAFKAQLLTLPGEADMTRALGGQDLDPVAMYQARKYLRRVIGRKLRRQLAEIHNNQRPKGPFRPDATSAGLRALANGALALLAATELASDIRRVITHTRKARNMTDKMAGMALLTHLDVPEREEIFSAFLKQWQDDHLVMDKWFSLQARSTLPGTLARVKELMKNPLFSLQNPNKVRALIGTFATANPLHFHAEDGSGYQLVADVISTVDGFNPQMAARLTAVFRNWRALDLTRRPYAENALETIARSKHLSRDTGEMVSRILG